VHGYAVYSIHQTQRTRMIVEYERRMHNQKTRRMKRKMKVFFEVGKLYAQGEEDNCVLPLPGMKGL